MGWRIEGIALVVIYFGGIIYFMRFGVGPAILGWAFFMAPGLGLIYAGVEEGVNYYIIFGIICFLVGAIPTYLDIKKDKEDFNRMVGKK